MSHTDGNRGFSLLETLLALAILGVLIATAIPAWRVAPERDTLARTTRELLSLMSESRSRAMFEGRPLLVFIDIGEDRVWADGILLQSAFRVPDDLDVAIITGRRLVFDDEIAAIAFFPDGTSSGGHVRLQQGDHVLQIDVDWLTGNARVVEDS